MDDAMRAGSEGSAVDDRLDEPFTEEELTALALGADPTLPLEDDAVPLHQFLAQLPSTLPSWYMPAAMARPGKGWRVPVVLGLVAAFVVIEAFGLCSTFGQVVVG
jgi:hypothetical protein